MECHLCGRSLAESSARHVRRYPACACLTPGCDGDSGDECEVILLCEDCL